jgi:hypothetical protein
MGHPRLLTASASTHRVHAPYEHFIAETSYLSVPALVYEKPTKYVFRYHLDFELKVSLALFFKIVVFVALFMKCASLQNISLGCGPGNGSFL